MTEMEIIIRRASDGTFVPITELVRCKKCKYFQKGIPIVNMCMLGHSPCCIDFFCADGKLKEGVHDD